MVIKSAEGGEEEPQDFLWWYGGIVVRGSKQSIKDFVERLQSELGLVVIKKEISPIMLRIVEGRNDRD